MRGKGYPHYRRPHQFMNAGRACQCVTAVTHSSHGHCISFKLIYNTMTTLSRQADRKISHSTLAATFLSHDSVDPRSLRSFYFWTRSLAGDIQDTTVPHVSRGGRARARVTRSWPTNNGDRTKNDWESIPSSCLSSAQYGLVRYPTRLV